MALPTSGQISASMINVELGRAANAPFDINGAQERALAGVPSGQIAFSNFYGKSSFTVGFEGGQTFSVYPDPPNATNDDFYIQCTSSGNNDLIGSTGDGPDYWGTPMTTGIGSQYESYVYCETMQISGGQLRFSDWINVYPLTAYQASPWLAMDGGVVLTYGGGGSGSLGYCKGTIFIAKKGTGGAILTQADFYMTVTG